MAYTFCVDFGSTFTKLCVFDLDNGELVMTTKKPTTVASDARTALLSGFAEAKRCVGEKGVKTARILTSSSAAGGLRMVVIGLTKRFSLLAGKNVALGAGARLIRAYENFLTNNDVHEIEKINPEIILLCGGVEGGNTERLLYNARILKNADISSYVVYAGNKAAAAAVRKELMSGSLKCYMTENIFPAYGSLNGSPAREIIRQLFMERIAGAKGLAKAFPIIGSVLMPTPAAVLAGGRLLAEGTERQKGFSSMMIFDVGGATTDVYSYIESAEGKIKHAGAPEPFAKRTVEGDLGVRSSCLSLAETMNLSAEAKRLDIEEEELLDFCRLRAERGNYIAGDKLQREIDSLLAEKAVGISARRHCGRIVNAYAKNPGKIMEGKDLTDIRMVLGTGGPVIHSRNLRRILSEAMRKETEETMLLPTEADFYVDKSYILYAVGLCAELQPDSALHIAKENMKKID